MQMTLRVYAWTRHAPDKDPWPGPSLWKAPSQVNSPAGDRRSERNRLKDAHHGPEGKPSARAWSDGSVLGKREFLWDHQLLNTSATHYRPHWARPPVPWTIQELVHVGKCQCTEGSSVRGDWMLGKWTFLTWCKIYKPKCKSEMRSALRQNTHTQNDA